MSLIDDIEKELRNPHKLTPHRSRKRVNWPVERIADLVEYVRAAEALYFPTAVVSAVEHARVGNNLQAARAKLGLK